MYNKENYFGHGALLLCGLSFKKGIFTLIKTVTLNRNQQPTKEQIQQIEAAAKKDIVFDEDSPALTPAMEKSLSFGGQKSKYTKENRCLIISNIGHFTKLFWRIPLNGSAIFV